MRISKYTRIWNERDFVLKKKYEALYFLHKQNESSFLNKKIEIENILKEFHI